VLFALLGLFAACYLVRLYELPIPYVTSHISNFAITGGVYMIGAHELLSRKPMSQQKFLLSLLPYAIINIVMELFVRVDTLRIDIVSFTNFNTPDPIDAVFGLAALALIWWVMMRYGFETAAARPTAPTRQRGARST
jgi:hypothetical protein